QAAPMADAAVRADLGEALDRLLPLAAQVALDGEHLVDVALDLRDLLVGEVADLLVGREAERRADLPRAGRSDPVDVGQPDLESLLIGEVHPRDACQHGSFVTSSSFVNVTPLPLPLLVPRVCADDHGRAVPLDHAAAFAHGLDRCS